MTHNVETKSRLFGVALLASALVIGSASAADDKYKDPNKPTATGQTPATTPATPAKTTPTATGKVTATGTPLVVKAGQIADEPSKYYGQRVSVKAEVEDVLGKQAFLLDEDKLFAYPDVLVVAPTLTTFVPEDEMVTVIGTVKPFVQTDIRRDYAWNWWNDLDSDVEMAFKDRPVIVAESIRNKDGVELVTKMSDRTAPVVAEPNVPGTPR